MWCHLVSDASLDELHTFAADLGCRRVGFQGDHYDIDAETRRLAIERGAQPCESRELVRRIRDAGLRVRPSTFEKWTLASRGDGALTNTTLDALKKGAPPALLSALSKVESSDFDRVRTGSSSWFVLRRAQSSAVVLGGTSANVVGPGGVLDSGDDAAAGIYARRTRGGEGAAWSIEVISPPIGPHQ